MSRPHGQRRGQALVEFALVLPIFLLIVLAVFDVGRLVFTYNSITNGAREGVRLAIVNQTQASVVARAVSQVAIAETAVPNVTVEYRRDGPNADFTTNPVCTTLGMNCVAIVRFQSTYRPITPIVSQVLFPTGVTVTATAIEPVEFVCPNTTTTAANCPKQP